MSQPAHNDRCQLPTLLEHVVPPHGPALTPIRIQTHHDASGAEKCIRVDVSPLQVKFESLAHKWLTHLERSWGFGDVEVLLDIDGWVSPVAYSEGVASTERFRRNPRAIPTTFQQAAWQLFLCYAQREVNQFPRRVSYSPEPARFCTDDILQEMIGLAHFMRAIEWLERAESPKRTSRKERTRLASSQHLARMLKADLGLSSAEEIDGANYADALNGVLNREDFLEATLSQESYADHLQVTSKIGPLAKRLIDPEGFQLPHDCYERLRRLWLEGLFHNPEPDCLSENEHTGNQPLVPPIRPLPISPVAIEGACILPIHLWRPSRLLGMICLYGEAAEEHRWEAVGDVGSLVESFILDSVKDNLLLFEAPHRLKACKTDSQVGDVVNYLAEKLVGTNDNCLQFRDKSTGVIRCAQANCQYQQVDFGPGFGVDQGTGTVYDNLNCDDYDGEIINDLMGDDRHLQACRKFVEEHGTTFYDRSSLNVGMQHANNPGIAVLQHVPDRFYTAVDYVDVDAVLTIAEMRLDELVAEGYRSFLESRRSEIPMNSAIYRDLLYNLDGEGIAAFLTQRLSKDCDTVGLLSKIGTQPDQKISVTDRLRSAKTKSMLDCPGFVQLTTSVTENQDLARAFWTGADGHTVWCDQFYNSRFPEKLESPAPLEGLPANRLVLWKPLSIEDNVYLWLERDLAPDEAANVDAILDDEAWWAIESVFRELESALTANWVATLNRNALRGVLARPLNHNIGSLLIEAVDAVRSLHDSAHTEQQKQVLRDLGYDAAEKSVMTLRNAIRSFAAIVRPTKLKRMAANDLIRRLSNQLSTECHQSKIDVEVTDNPTAQAIVSVDMDQLMIAFRELLNNTKDELANSHGHKKIWLSCEESQGWLKVIYEDSGQGIDTSRREWIFHSETTTKSTGTGLGLFIVRSLVQAHHGRVSADEPAPDRGGVRFVVELPLSK